VTRALYTEAEMLDMLKRRHTAQGNGGAGEWAFLTHVRDAAGFDAKRTIDALAMGLWPSRGLSLHAFEVKCSRSDYLAEIRNPAKAEAFGSRVDYFWIVVADPKIVKDDLPEGWGLLAATAPKVDEETGAKTLGTLRVVKQAPKQPLTREQTLITRSWLVSLLRAAGAVPGSNREVEDAEIRAARDEGYATGQRVGQRNVESYQQRIATLEAQVQREQAVRAAFERAAGVQLDGWREHGLGRAERVGDVVRAALKGDSAVETAARQMERMEAELRRLADSLAETREGSHGAALLPRGVSA
jgi:hypothetical protein